MHTWPPAVTGSTIDAKRVENSKLNPSIFLEYKSGIYPPNKSTSAIPSHIYGDSLTTGGTMPPKPAFKRLCQTQELEPNTAENHTQHQLQSKTATAALLNPMTHASPNPICAPTTFGTGITQVPIHTTCYAQTTSCPTITVIPGNHALKKPQKATGTPGNIHVTASGTKLPPHDPKAAAHTNGLDAYNLYSKPKT